MAKKTEAPGKGETKPPTGETPSTGGETAKATTAPSTAKPAKAEGGRGPELRKKLGEPEPTEGAVVDPKTGRTEKAPGFDATRRKPQTA